jgi:uncharacterized SAM-binding protein YcdF (DUF218 family)
MTSTIRPERSRRRGAALLAAAAIAAVLALAFRDAPGRFLVVDDHPAACDAVVVLAGDPDYERTATAVALMRAHLAKRLFLTGGEPGPGDSAASLREQALAGGVAAEAIRMETVSRSTREAMVALGPLLRAEGVRSVIVVTSPYHTRRAAAAARKAWPDIEVRSHPAEPSFWHPEAWWMTGASRTIVGKEYVKLAYYRFRGWI